MTTPPITRREQFLHAVYNTLPQPCDAIVVLCGEDGLARTQAGVGLFVVKVAPVILFSGGVSTPPARLDAPACAALAMGMGVSATRLLTNAEALNTREQAVQVVGTAQAMHWRALALVASAYHLPRALLTMVRALEEAGVRDRVRVIPHAAYGDPHGAPPGMSMPRADLLDVEFGKIAAYTAHCADYESGLAYLHQWATRPPAP